MEPKVEQPTDMGRHAALVAAGILLSRIAGLIRDRVFAHYFGNSEAADAFRAAFRIPNFLQNLFGEGVLSASFIPVYANLLAQGSREEADRVAAAVFCLLSLFVSCLVLIGVLTTPLLIDAIAPGFRGAKRELTISLVRILFPGAALSHSVGVVPWYPQQSPAIFYLVHSPGSMESGDDRLTHWIRRSLGAVSTH